MLVVKKIPKGKVMTYGTVALAAGSPGAARAVGQIMAGNPNPFFKTKRTNKRVPCHRVVRADGSIGGYSGGSQRKESLLKSEGINVIRGKVPKKYFTSP